MAVVSKRVGSRPILGQGRHDSLGGSRVRPVFTARSARFARMATQAKESSPQLGKSTSEEAARDKLSEINARREQRRVL
jgi:hypothetical protein